MNRTSQGTACTRIGLVVNVLLTALKLMAGIVGHSQAMIADALNSSFDVVATGAVYIGLKIAEKPADQNHPFGHGNADTLAAVFVALILLLTGVFVGVSAVHIILHREYLVPSNLALGVAIFSIIIKEILFRYTLRVGLRINSQAIVANARDHRSDVYSSSAVLLGIVGAKLGVVMLDPIAGLFIAGLIVKMAFHLMRANVNILMDGTPDGSILHDVISTAGAVDGVVETKDTRIHPVGPANIVSLEILVDGNLTVEEGHEIASRVKRTLIEEHHSIQDVIVHVEPHGESGDPKEGSGENHQA